MICEVFDLGLVQYDLAWSLQETYAEEIARGARSAAMLLLEHPHIYTLGTAGDASHLLWNDAQLNERNVSLRRVDRGGDITYHGPGQLVGYPLIPLGGIAAAAHDVGTTADAGARIPRADYVGYVRKLERALIVALADLGVAAAQIPRLTGVWVQPDVFSRCPRCKPADRRKPAKIAAIGVRVDARGISRHGFALNINPDMTYWDGIVACGLPQYPVVSLADLMRDPPSMSEVKRRVVSATGEVFGWKMAWMPAAEVALPEPPASAAAGSIDFSA